MEPTPTRPDEVGGDERGERRDFVKSLTVVAGIVAGAAVAGGAAAQPPQPQPQPLPKLPLPAGGLLVERVNVALRLQGARQLRDRHQQLIEGAILAKALELATTLGGARATADFALEFRLNF